MEQLFRNVACIVGQHRFPLEDDLTTEEMEFVLEALFFLGKDFLLETS